MKRIATHSKPDADAIAAAWLAETFMFPCEEVEILFVPRLRPGQPGPAADCLVDISCIHDPARLMFDHKPPAFADRNATCATRLVWEYLLSLGRRLRHLEALVRVVHEGDRSPPGRPSPELATSRSEGFHFHLKQARAQGGGDVQVYQEMRGWLDLYDRAETARLGPMRDTGPEGVRTERAGGVAHNACAAAAGYPPAIPVTPGKAKAKFHREARATRAGPPRGPASATGDDGLLTLESLLAGYGCPAKREDADVQAVGADPADRVAAMRENIDHALARSEPGSKASKFLRGLRVLVEVEAVLPGHLGGRRREDDGWIHELSLAKGRPGREACERVALEFGTDSGTLSAEVKLAEAVQVIVRNCGVGTLKPLLTQGGRLGEPVVLSIARKGPERQRYAMAEAAQGRDPMARPSAGVWPMDTRDFAKVPGRLGRALGAVDGCVAVLPALLEHQRPSGEEVAAMRRHSARIVECSEQLLRIVGGRGAAEAPRLVPDVPARGSAPDVVVDKGPIGKSGTFAQVSGRLDAAQYFVEKTARDVARMPTGLRPTPERASQIRGQLMALIGRAGRLIEVIGAGRPRR